MLSWGKCRVLYKIGDDVSWSELPTPVENSTTLTTTQGTKNEAKVEGGENEDVKYGRNTYALNTSVRMAADRTPIENSDGVITEEASVIVQPEDTAAVGIYIERASASVQDSFNTQDGGRWAYVFDALKPKAATTGLNTRQVREGIVTITESNGAISSVTFKELGKDTAVSV